MLTRCVQAKRFYYRIKLRIADDVWLIEEALIAQVELVWSRPAVVVLLLALATHAANSIDA